MSKQTSQSTQRDDSPVQPHPAKIRWGARLPMPKLKKLYEADAAGIQDIELCDEVGSYLYSRCRTFALVKNTEVECPSCGTVVAVAKDEVSHCSNSDCDWYTDFHNYWKSIQNHYAWFGRGLGAFLGFYERYPAARTYRQKIVLIDQLIHSFHMDEAGQPVKSVASKLLEGNKNDVVRFLDDLSAIDKDAKTQWRGVTATTVNARLLSPSAEDSE
ncbi:MAG TPA: hypothetical protein VND22_07600 [Actinomycetota bacterium]|nr:hypothetical protein [Actinomycetota bacterium]